jgi:hypothetical protein
MMGCGSGLEGHMTKARALIDREHDACAFDDQAVKMMGEALEETWKRLAPTVPQGAAEARLTRAAIIIAATREGITSLPALVEVAVQNFRHRH